MSCKLNNGEHNEDVGSIYGEPTRSFEEYNKAGIEFLKEVFKKPKILKNKNAYKKVLGILNNHK